jgi:hypothetical protein
LSTFEPGNIPTTYKNLSLPQPLVVTANTHYGEMYDFARSFTNYEAVNRPFEYFTVSSMVLSPMEGGHHTIPIYEILVGCGDYLYASSYDVMPEVSKAIAKTVSHTYMPGKVPENTMRTSSSPKYTLVPLNGKNYEALDIDFLLPDGFELDFSNFRMSPDPATGMAEPIPMVGQCIGTDPVDVEYSLDYPVVVSIKDPESNSILQFAIQVKVVGNQPGGWDAVSPEDDIMAEICSDPTCLIDLEIEDTSGSPLEGANVRFMGCFIGNTDGSGSYSGLAPCGLGSLHVAKRGFGDFSEVRTSGELTGSVALEKMPVVNLVFHEVVVQDQGSGQYMVFFGDVIPIQERRVYITFRPFGDPVKEYNFFTQDSSLTVKNMPAGDYVLAVSLTEPVETGEILKGGLIYFYDLDESFVGDLHVYIPSTFGLNSITDETERKQKVSDLSEALYECGIGPLTQTPYYQEEACVVNLS